MANIGGFFGCNNDEWAEDFRNLLILTEGFPTLWRACGRRDLEVIAVGLKEALEYEYQRYRHATVEYMARDLIARKIPIVRPPGGHAVFIDAAAFCPHLKPCDYPGIGLVNALYLEGGIRAVELGSVMFGRPLPGRKDEIPASRELVRLAFPRLHPKSFRLRHRSAGSRLAAARCDPILQNHKTCAISRRISIVR
jgi:tryptophanase